MVAARSIGGPALNRKALSSQVRDDLRARLSHHEWRVGERLPTEGELVNYYRVSRPTVREALKSLENQGLILTQRGRGSFVLQDSGISAGMHELRSITSTIREMGHEPAMVYHHRFWRDASPEESDKFNLEDDLTVLDIQRKVLADGEAVCYNYDTLPRWTFPPDFEPEELTGSIFAFLASHGGPTPRRAVARVRPVAQPDVVWDEEFSDSQLFLNLDQLHYSDSGRPFMHTNAYFIDGRFSFTVVRLTTNY